MTIRCMAPLAIATALFMGFSLSTRAQTPPSQESSGSAAPADMCAEPLEPLIECSDDGLSACETDFPFPEPDLIVTCCWKGSESACNDAGTDPTVYERISVYVKNKSSKGVFAYIRITNGDTTKKSYKTKEIAPGQNVIDGTAIKYDVPAGDEGWWAIRDKDGNPVKFTAYSTAVKVNKFTILELHFTVFDD